MISGSAMFGLSLLSFLLVLPAALATKAVILFPLYIYPGDDAVNWNPLFNQIRAYPNMVFRVIVNLDSGPGATQDPNFVYGLELLHSNANVLLYGYVDTQFGNYSVAHIENDLDLWKAYGADAPTGIFFDDVAENDPAATSIMQQVTAYAINTDGFDPTQIVFNCGTLPPRNSLLYNYASQIVIEEGNYTSNTAVVGLSGQTQQHLTVIFYNGSATTSVVQSQVYNWCGLVNSMFVTNLPINPPNPGGPYGAFGANLPAFCSAISSCPH